MSHAPSVSTAGHVLAVDTGARTLAEAEHLVHGLEDTLGGALPPDHVVSTHLLRSPTSHFAVVLGWPASGPRPADVRATLLAHVAGLCAIHDHVLATSAELGAAAALAAVEHRTRSSGRLVRYPGRTAVERCTTAREVVAQSCIDAVEGLAGTLVSPDSRLDLSGFARPAWREGRCTLLVQQGRDGMLLPFEVRDQQSCCADH